MLARLKLKEGDKLHVVEQTERGIKLSPYDPKHAKAMEIARRSFRKYADTYKALGEMTEPEWLDLDIVLDIPCRATGAVRRRPTEFAISGCSSRALARPLNKFAYGETDIARSRPPTRLASRAIIRSSTATSARRFASMIVFLGLNEIDLDAPQEEATAMILALAAGEIDEDGLARWIADIGRHA